GGSDLNIRVYILNFYESRLGAPFRSSSGLALLSHPVEYVLVVDPYRLANEPRVGDIVQTVSIQINDLVLDIGYVARSSPGKILSHDISGMDRKFNSSVRDLSNVLQNGSDSVNHGYRSVEEQVLRV